MFGVASYVITNISMKNVICLIINHNIDLEYSAYNLKQLFSIWESQSPREV